MLEKVKAALRLTVEDYDGELTDMIRAALMDLKIAGINPDTLSEDFDDPLITMAVITYCRMHFGSPDDFERMARSYDEQKRQLWSASGYGLNGDADGGACCGQSGCS